MIKLRNVIIYISVCIIVLASFKLPDVLLKTENINIAIEVYDREKKSIIDVESQDIYLVKAIHDIEEGRTIEIVSPEKMFVWGETTLDTGNGLSKNVYEQLSKLIDYNILKNINLSENVGWEMGVINKNYQKNENTYTVKYIVLKIENDSYILNIENKTGKISYIAFGKNNLYDVDNKKEMLEKYISYLNLFIVQDWQYETDEVNKVYAMKSETAGIKVSLVETLDNFLFSVHIY